MWHAAAAPPTATVAPAVAAAAPTAAPRVAVQSGRSGPFCPPSHDAFAHRETIAVHAICRGAVRGVVVQCCSPRCLCHSRRPATRLPTWVSNATHRVLVGVLVLRVLAYRIAAIENGFVSISTH